MQSKILITGATGLLGPHLAAHFKSHGQIVTTQARKGGADYLGELSEQVFTHDMVSKSSPNIIVNLVANTNVDVCEDNPARCFLDNVKSVENIVSAIRSVNKPCHLIQLSTDQLYSGEGPHGEDKALPVNYYAWSKYLSENVASQAGATSLRVNFAGKSITQGRSSFTDWLYQSAKDQTPIKAFNDVLFGPLSIQTLCKTITLACEKQVAGTFNLGSQNGMSKAAFGKKFLTAAGQSTDHITVTSVASFEFKATRPNDMRMKLDAFENTFGFQLPSTDAELETMAADY